MKSVCLSVCVRANVASAVIVVDGALHQVNTFKFSQDTSSVRLYSGLMEAFKKGLLMVKRIMEENSDVVLVIECNNLTFINWLKRGYSKDEHEVAFSEVMQVLHNIPSLVRVIYSQSPKAKMFLSNKYLKKDKITRFDLGTLEV